MNKTTAFEKLKKIRQENLLDSFETLNAEEAEALLIQIENLDLELFQIQQHAALHPQLFPSENLEPFTDYETQGNPANVLQGKHLISQGKTGCLLIAGGQGTRLGFDNPKGMFPISLIKKKTLFQLFAEKVAAAGRAANSILPIAVMTAPQNDEQTRRFFAEHNYFGLDPKQIDFFTQKELPLLNEKGNLFFDRKGHIAMGPDGNGSSLANFYASGLWEIWFNHDVRFVNYVLIDNPLADPFDAELIGYHAKWNLDVAIKCIERFDPNEKVGVLVKRGNKVHVVEYSEMSEEEKTAIDRNGNLKYRCANLSLFCFSMKFIEKAATKELSFHVANKACSRLEKDKILQTGQPNSWKFEKFIFDVLPYAEKVRALVYSREECFAPLKNLTGSDTVETVQKALLSRDKKVFEQTTGSVPAEEKIELSPDFYYISNVLDHNQILDENGYYSMGFK